MIPHKKKHKAWAFLPILAALPLLGGLFFVYVRFGEPASELVNAIMKLGVQP